MGATDLTITSIGMTTSLGVGRVDACGAARAGLVRLSELRSLNAANDVRFGKETLDGVAPLVGHIVPTISEGRAGLSKLLALSLPAVTEIVEHAMTTARALGRIGLCINLSDAYFQLRYGERGTRGDDDVPDYRRFWDETVSAFPGRLSAALAHLIQPRVQFARAGGRVGLVRLLEEASHLIHKGQVDRCLVGCVESCIEPEALQAYAQAGVLRTSDNPVGFFPGEAAVFLLVEPAGRSQSGLGLKVSAVAQAEDAPYLETDSVACGRGIHAAISAAVRARELPAFPAVVSVDLNGGEARAADWGYAQVLLKSEFGDVGYDTWLPAVSFGETGAVSGALAICSIFHSIERRCLSGSNALIVLCGEDGGRGTILLENLLES
jgi:3-oxoacyl-[acyl-carrier-protein] synthase I